MLFLGVGFTAYFGYQSRTEMQQVTLSSQKSKVSTTLAGSVEPVTNSVDKSIVSKRENVSSVRKKQLNEVKVVENDVVLANEDRTALHKSDPEKRKLALAMVKRNLINLEAELIKAEAEGDVDLAEHMRVRIERLYRQMDEIHQL